MKTHWALLNLQQTPQESEALPRGTTTDGFRNGRDWGRGGSGALAPPARRSKPRRGEDGKVRSRPALLCPPPAHSGATPGPNGRRAPPPQPTPAPAAAPRRHQPRAGSGCRRAPEVRAERPANRGAQRARAGRSAAASRRELPGDTSPLLLLLVLLLSQRPGTAGDLKNRNEIGGENKVAVAPMRGAPREGLNLRLGICSTARPPCRIGRWW